jgi:TatD family-associated radical SAM protein
MRLEAMLEVCKLLKERWPQVPVRLNTNGQANLNYAEDITPRLKGLVDTVSISLNAPTSEEYDAVCRPAMGGKSFEAMLSFAAACRDRGISVVMTVVDTIGKEKIEQSRAIAERLGVQFRVRTYIEAEEE